ncbi:MAG: HEAT repeat domain-containing protein [Candidatus Eremiobacteraeota bacterium]|nr:HEAT repeat domain-containing protein [Candidatus Eremiobacteraeota bacterium]
MDKIMQFLPVNIDNLEKKKDIPGLVKVLNTHKDNATRQKAAFALSKVRDENGIPHLVSILENKAEPEKLRSSCALALGQFKNEEAEIVLIKAMKTEESEEVRSGILQALADFNTPGSIKALVIAIGDKSARIKNSAGSSLGIANEAAAQCLYNALCNENDQARLKAARDIGATKNRKIIDIIAAFSRDPDSRVRKKAIQALGAFDSEAVIEPLRERLEKDEDENVSAVFTALSRIKSDKLIDTYIEGLGRLSHTIRQSCINALCERRTEKCVEAIIPLLKDPNEAPELRVNIAKALGKVKGNISLDALLAVLDTDHDALRTRVEESLAEMGHPDLAARLVVLASSENENVRRSVVKIFGKIKKAHTADTLVDMLNDSSEEVRSHVVLNLGEFSVPKVIDSLSKILGDRSEKTAMRGSAARSLGRIADERAIYPLLDALKDEEEYVRGSAAMALGAFKKGEVIESLGAALNDRSELVRCYAVESLGQVKDVKVLDILKRAEQDPSDKVKEAVARAMKNVGK